MDGMDEQLRQLVTEACKHRPGSAERQKNLTKIIRLVSNKLWKENKPYYQDALQQTWVYFCQNICEGKTGEPYNPSRGSVITWLNFYLKRRLQDFYLDDKKQQARTASGQSQGLGSTDAQSIDPIDKLAAEPDVPLLLEEVKRWVETDPEGELRRIHISNRPDVTCQLLILRRLPPEESWKALAAELNLTISTLSSFYQRQCLPRLRKFGELEGYL
ncbi:MAG: sigma-70 family RNA polymerase sigma factor [Coleofasciculus sp. Co-bin14]|nr:sigma-70 family RNA polymerase sigma factor [Coleofasciculus sp. Co-bin14]